MTPCIFSRATLLMRQMFLIILLKHESTFIHGVTPLIGPPRMKMQRSIGSSRWLRVSTQHSSQVQAAGASSRRALPRVCRYLGHWSMTCSIVSSDAPQIHVVERACGEIFAIRELTAAEPAIMRRRMTLEAAFVT